MYGSAGDPFMTFVSLAFQLGVRRVANARGVFYQGCARSLPRSVPLTPYRKRFFFAKCMISL